MTKATLLNKSGGPVVTPNICGVYVCFPYIDPCWTDDPCPNYVNPCTTDCGGSGGVNRLPS